MSNQDEILKRTKEALDKAVDEARRNRSFLSNIGLAVVETLRPVLEKLSQIKIEPPNVEVPKAEVQVKIPEIKVPTPQVYVTVPEIKIPEIKIPEIKVPKIPKPDLTVNVPPIKLPEIKIPKIEFPSDLEVSLRKDIDAKNPMPVILMDNKGNPYMAVSGAGAPRIVDVNVINPYTSIADGRRTVTTAGTAVRLTANATNAKTVIITALLANTDVVVIGGSGVIAAAGTRTGIPLLPGQAVTLAFNDLTNIWMDSVVNGEGVSFLIMN